MSTSFSSTSPGWLQYMPAATLPYIYLSRLHYFAGPNLLFWPCAWGLTLGASCSGTDAMSLFHQIGAYFLGSLVLHSVGSSWNDICDQDLDAQVERTKNRPLVVGSVTTVQALLFLLPQVVILVVLLRMNNDLSFYLGVFGLFFWVPLYPLMKRVTYWPQAWLGIAGNWGLLVAYASVTGSIASTACTLFFGSWCWCIHYDTIYGMMDRKDDIKVGIKSTALLFGPYSRFILCVFASGFLAALVAVGNATGAPFSYYVVAIGGTGVHLIWQLFSVDFESNKSCFMIFGVNSTQLGYIVWMGFLIVYLQSSVSIDKGLEVTEAKL